MHDDHRPQRPAYDQYTRCATSRSSSARLLARQVLATTGPWLNKPIREIDVLDIGSGYGNTAAELAKVCRSVVGIEPAGDLFRSANSLLRIEDRLEFRHASVEELSDDSCYDLVVLDNVYEHLPDQHAALTRVSASLRPGGVFYILVPNKLWPIEAHYRLPFLAWLPMRAANAYLRWSGRGSDYTDASYAPTLSSLRRALEAQGELEWQLTLPGDRAATTSGSPMHYRLGMTALARFPVLWNVSKALLVVGRKRDQ